jgi:hypothetical protein
MASECTVLLNETFEVHVLKGSLLCHDKGNLGKLCSEEKTCGMAEGVLGRSNIDIAKERESLDVGVLVHGVVGHIHVLLADCLTFDASKMNSLLLGVVFDDFND